MMNILERVMYIKWIEAKINWDKPRNKELESVETNQEKKN